MQVHDADLKLLRVFDTIVRCGGFAAAQSLLGIGASSISEHMAKLETRLGVRLCERGRGGFRLTEEGLQTHAAAQRMLAAIDTFELEASTIRKALRGVLRLGLIEATLTDRSSPLLHAMQAFGQAAPEVHLHIEIESPGRLEQRVLDGSLHLAVAPFQEMVAGLHYRPLYSEEQGLYCAAPHPLFSPASEGDLAGHVAHAKLATRGYLGRMELDMLGVAESAAMVDNVEGRAMLILSGNYIGFLPPHYADALVGPGVLRRIAPERYSTRLDFRVVTRRGTQSARTVQTLIDQMIAAASAVSCGKPN